MIVNKTKIIYFTQKLIYGIYQSISLNFNSKIVLFQIIQNILSGKM